MLDLETIKKVNTDAAHGIPPFWRQEFKANDEFTVVWTTQYTDNPSKMQCTVVTPSDYGYKDVRVIRAWEWVEMACSAQFKEGSAFDVIKCIAVFHGDLVGDLLTGVLTNT
jgi:hypothetical protein